MRTITLKIDNSIYQKFLTLIELFPKSKLKITESAEPKPNKDSLRAMRDIEEGKNCDSFANANEMFQAYDIQSV